MAEFGQTPLVRNAKQRTPDFYHEQFPAGSVDEAMLAQFLAQGAAIDAQDVGGQALIALGVFKDGAQQRFFDLPDDQLVQGIGLVPVQRLEIAAQRFFGKIAKGFLVDMNFAVWLPASGRAHNYSSPLMLPGCILDFDILRRSKTAFRSVVPAVLRSQRGLLSRVPAPVFRRL